jgi:hypothetical protein
MSKSKGGIIGAIVTVVVGSVTYSISRTAIVENFSRDTGMSKQEAEQYVENITEDDLVDWDELGSEFITEGEELISSVADIDCVNYYYEWETDSFSCEEGKSQLTKLANSSIALGKGYMALASESASDNEISSVIRLIDRYNSNLTLEIVKQILDYQTIDEIRKTNSYNKSVLQAALDSE